MKKATFSGKAVKYEVRRIKPTADSLYKQRTEIEVAAGAFVGVLVVEQRSARVGEGDEYAIGFTTFSQQYPTGLIKWTLKNEIPVSALAAGDERMAAWWVFGQMFHGNRGKMENAAVDKGYTWRNEYADTPPFYTPVVGSKQVEVYPGHFDEHALRHKRHAAYVAETLAAMNDGVRFWEPGQEPQGIFVGYWRGHGAEAKVEA